MCAVNSDKGQFEVVVTDLQKNVICCLDFASITLVCKFLDDFDFDYGDASVYRKKDLQYFDPKVILQLWRREI